MIPLVVTAYLQQGYVTRDPWSPALDGILAALVLRERLGEEEYALGMSGGRALIEPELPLERDGDAECWWWCCSSPIVGETIVHEAWFHRRFDGHLALERVDERVRKVQTKGGAYKAYRNRDTVIVPRDSAMRWHCIGDQAEIERLLRRCTVVGAGGARGRGQVRGWSVTPEGADAELARNHRPIPLEVALARGLSGVTQRAGIRPPARAPEHQALCILP